MANHTSNNNLGPLQAAQSLTTLTTITTNNNLTTLMFTPEIGDKQEQESFGHLLASPEGFAPQVAVSQSVSSPAKWKYAKVDLFDNTTEKQLKKGVRKLRVSLSFLTHTNPTYQYIGALMNSRIRDVKRGFDFSDAYEQAHYDLLLQTYTELKEMSEYQNVRLSKCYGRSVKGKGKTIFGMSVILAEKKQDGEYLVLIMDGVEITPINLTAKNLTDKQRQGNCISSGQHGSNTIKRMTRNDFLS
jgi:hypothetical protein